MTIDMLRNIFAPIAMSEQPSLRYKKGRDVLPCVVCDTESFFEAGPRRLHKKEMENFLVWLRGHGTDIRLAAEDPKMARRELSFYGLDSSLLSGITNFAEAFAEADQKNMNVIAGIAADISSGFDNMESYGVENIVNGRDERFELFVLAEKYIYTAQGLPHPDPILR